MKSSTNQIKICRWEQIKLKLGPNSIRVVAQSRKGNLEDSCEWKLGSSKP